MYNVLEKNVQCVYESVECISLTILRVSLGVAMLTQLEFVLVEGN
jgi:hypothetical protein